MTTTAPICIHADHETTKRLGNWTDAKNFVVKARYSAVVIDLRSPLIDGCDEIAIQVDLDHAMLKLLVPDDAVIDQAELQWVGRGRVKDFARPKDAAGRTIRLTGRVSSGEFRVHRAGVAVLSALFSREFFEDARQARKEGRTPTLIDPANAAR